MHTLSSSTPSQAKATLALSRLRSARSTASANATKAALCVAATLSLGAQAQTLACEGVSATSPVAVIVKVPKPWYAPRLMVERKMRETVPVYEALPGLAFKAFSFARADGHYGGIYLWKDLASAQAWFTPAWFARVEKERGARAEVRCFEVRAAVDNTPGGTRKDLDSAAVATVSALPSAVGAEQPPVAQALQAEVSAARRVPGLLRRYVFVTAAGGVEQINLWRDAAAAQASRPEGDVEWFDTPLLLPSRLPDQQPKIPGL
jgi:hypothetical protein